MPLIELEKSADEAVVFVSLFFGFAGFRSSVLNRFQLRSLLDIQVEVWRQRSGV